MTHRTIALLLLCGPWSAAPAPSGPVKITPADDGGVAVATPAYRVRIGPDGCLWSIQAGGVEFLRSDAALGHGSMVIDRVKPGHYGVLHTELTREDLGRPVTKAAQTTAKGPKTTLTYRFRPTAFDVITVGAARRGFYLLLPSENVQQSLDVQTDRAIQLDKDKPIGLGQEGMRWVTRQGPVLKVTERVDGYTNCYWWAQTGKFTRAGVSLRVAQGRTIYTFHPIAAPSPVDAVHFAVGCEQSDFLLPGRRPVRFDIQAANVGPTRQKLRVDFEVRDYCTREPVGRVATELDLAGGASQPVAAEVAVDKPGPYRGALVVKEAGKAVREIGWVFVYDFPSYRPALTRPPDFKAFWAETFRELARVPMAPKLKLNEKFSNPGHEVYEVSLATLGGERFWAWYSKPRKPGKYPVIYRCPPTGPYHPPPGPGMRSGGPYVHFYIAVHGFDLYLSDRDPANAADPRNRYHRAGIESPRTSRWRLIFASLVRGMDFLRSRPEVDPKRIAVAGSSQGGGAGHRSRGAPAASRLLPPHLCRPLPAGLDRGARGRVLAVQGHGQTQRPVHGRVCQDDQLLRCRELCAGHPMPCRVFLSAFGLGDNVRRTDRRIRPPEARPS